MAVKSTAFRAKNRPIEIRLKTDVEALLAVYRFVEVKGEWEIGREPKMGDVAKAVSLPVDEEEDGPCCLLVFVFPLDQAAFDAIRSYSGPVIEVQFGR